MRASSAGPVLFSGLPMDPRSLAFRCISRDQEQFCPKTPICWRTTGSATFLSSSFPPVSLERARPTPLYLRCFPALDRRSSDEPPIKRAQPTRKRLLLSRAPRSSARKPPHTACPQYPAPTAPETASARPSEDGPEYAFPAVAAAMLSR